MSFDVCVKAPAKVNIGLKVLKKRADGFHNIESIFQTLDFSDELHVRRIPQKECIVRCTQMQLPLENTLTKTYSAFCSETNIDFGIEVLLDKFLPAGGGLGGGSSDGASLLKGLSDLAEIQLTDSLADAVAEKVGSDVFFFLHSGFFQKGRGCALVSGRGEVVKAIEPRTDLSFLLIFPGIHSSTKEAYSLVDQAYESGLYESKYKVSYPDFSELKRLYYGFTGAWKFTNSFTPVLIDKYPLIGAALKDILECGADWADMSGSGATVFGVFKSDAAAKEAYLKCQKKWKCVVAH
ncbi:MAG: 4-(cytidine 5'-diphospho)-2-C-methyl-D-erythritol kinase [Treponema sp.]|uniref:4-(cytidine 5'-diphospho)-2-C-methyl-D-erythritol kinase n=1 Tax=Treponema sp. TaxID=166 RepID=UPI001AFDE7B7|nr:4-(cytidine 5'-diphospho)-2-C-methyl-D-erythritol kinase [Treponema sp.]MBO6218278.1 4-(cytidine 5'-diphospho)-2-C-methyl-D-erythritol kinase [Treponema sp.]MBQ8680925.1 4-(cytidine 5'-diphospho)-2-C-methyl-D-erythritol kinase [Treponema sp.]